MVYNIYIYHDKYSITRAPLSNDNETGYNGYTYIYIYLSRPDNTGKNDGNHEI